MAVQEKIHLVINALPLQDSHHTRGIGRYTFEVISGILDLWQEQSPLMANISGITIVGAQSPSLQTLLARPLSHVTVVTAPGNAPTRNLIRGIYYNTIFNASLTSLFKEIKKRGETSVYLLPRHQITTHPLADYTVAMVHDLIPLSLQRFHNNPIMSFFLSIEYKQYLQQLKQVDCILTNSIDSAQSVAKHLNREHDIYPIYLGTSLQTVDIESVKKEPSPIIDRYFVYYGGYDYNKNIPGIMKIFGTFTRAYEDTSATKLVFIGGKNCTTLLAKLAKQEGIPENIVITETISDTELVSYLLHSQGLFRLSFAEGFGLPELEALSIAVPVISSSIGPIKELFYSYASLYDPHNPDGITAELHALAKDLGPSPEQRDKARVYALAFTWRQTAETTMSTITEYVANHLAHEYKNG